MKHYKSSITCKIIASEPQKPKLKQRQICTISPVQTQGGSLIKCKAQVH